MTWPESEVRMSSAGTQGWTGCQPLSKRRMGIPGPNSSEPLDGSPYYVAIKLRSAGHHKGHRSFWEWDDSKQSWMLLVLDDQRNIIGQVIGRTQEACNRKMNDIYVAKGLGVYNGRYAEGVPNGQPTSNVAEKLAPLGKRWAHPIGDPRRHEA